MPVAGRRPSLGGLKRSQAGVHSGSVESGRCLRPIEDLEQTMDFQGVVINVAELDRSIDFYCEVLGCTVLTKQEQLAVVDVPGSERTQVLVLRALGTSPMGGARHVGLRSFVLEVDSADQLERIATGLEARDRADPPTRAQQVDRGGR